MYILETIPKKPEIYEKRIHKNTNKVYKLYTNDTKTNIQQNWVLITKFKMDKVNILHML